MSTFETVDGNGRDTELLLQIASRVDQLVKSLAQLQEQLAGRTSAEPEALSVAEAAKALQRAPFTVREWARLGRIVAYRASNRGPYQEWRIPQESIRYYQQHGLLPVSQGATSFHSAFPNTK